MTFDLTALFGFIVAKLLLKMNERHFIIFLFFLCCSFISMCACTGVPVRVCNAGVRVYIWHTHHGNHVIPRV